MKWSILFYIIYLGLCSGQLPESLVNEEKCNKIGGTGTFEKLKAADAEAKACIHGLFDGATFQNEIDKRHENTALNRAVGSYGVKGPQVYVCIKKKIELIKLCLTKDEKKQYNTVIEILRKVADYVYENDGERVVTFVEKGGIECLKSRLGQVRNCFGDNPLIILESEMNDCRNYDRIKNCVVQELETNCPSSIPANITDDLLRFARTSICSNNKIIRSKRSLKRVVRNVVLGPEKLTHLHTVLENVCTAEEGKFNQTVETMHTCMRGKTLFDHPEEEYIGLVKNCSQPIIKLLDECLPEKLRYLPRLVLKIVVSVIRLFYDDYKEIVFGVAPCVPKLKSKESEKEYHSCIHKLEDADNVISESKTEFCGNFLPLTRCFTKQLNNTCNRTPDLVKFIEDYTKAMEDPCGP